MSKECRIISGLQNWEAGVFMWCQNITPQVPYLIVKGITCIVVLSGGHHLNQMIKFRICNSVTIFNSQKIQEKAE